MKLDHENLDVYKLSIEFLAWALRVVNTLPRGESGLSKQFKEAAISVPLNIAEGAGRTSPIDRARCHAIARGSALECGALVDVCAVAGHISEREGEEGKNLLVRVVAMLSKMCR